VHGALHSEHVLQYKSRITASTDNLFFICIEVTHKILSLVWLRQKTNEDRETDPSDQSKLCRATAVEDDAVKLPPIAT